jgi:hypothetical protein
MALVYEQERVASTLFLPNRQTPQQHSLNNTEAQDKSPRLGVGIDLPLLLTSIQDEYG